MCFFRCSLDWVSSDDGGDNIYNNFKLVQLSITASHSRWHISSFSFLLAALEEAADIAQGRKQSSSAKAFRNAAAAGADAQQAEFMAQAGLSVLLLLRNYCAHVSFRVTEEALRSGITEAAVDYVVQAASLEVISLHGDLFAIGMDGALLRKRAPL